MCPQYRITVPKTTNFTLDLQTNTQHVHIKILNIHMNKGIYPQVVSNMCTTYPQMRNNSIFSSIKRKNQGVFNKLSTGKWVKHLFF